MQSLWEANMDLLSHPPKIELNDPAWRIYSRNPVMPPHYVGDRAEISDSLVTEGGTVYGRVEHSVLFAGVSIGEHAVVTDSVIFPGAVIGEGARIHKAIIGENVRIGRGAVIGGALREGEVVDNRLTGDITLVGNDICICSGAYLPCGTVAAGAYEEQDG